MFVWCQPENFGTSVLHWSPLEKADNKWSHIFVGISWKLVCPQRYSHSGINYDFGLIVTKIIEECLEVEGVWIHHIYSPTKRKFASEMDACDTELGVPHSWLFVFVLVWAGVKVIFSREAGTWLCFEFVLKKLQFLSIFGEEGGGGCS